MEVTVCSIYNSRSKYTYIELGGKQDRRGTDELHFVTANIAPGHVQIGHGDG